MRLLLSCLALALLSTATPTRAQEACRLTGRADRLPVTVPAVGDALLLTGHHVEVTLDASRTRAEARVPGPIAFTGTVDPLSLRMRVRPGRSLADGTLRLDGSAHVHLLAEGSVAALLGPGLTATLPSLPCSSLTLTRPADREIDSTRLPQVTHRIAAGLDLPLFATDRATEASATLHTSEAIDVTVRRVRGARAEIVTDLGMSRIRGWVDASLLTAIEPHEATLSMMGDMTGGACGRSDHPYSYDGPARVRIGATVRGPSGAEWGRVTRPLPVERLAVRAFDPSQAELLRVHGFESLTCGQDLLFDLAIVSLDDVSMPTSN